MASVRRINQMTSDEREIERRRERYGSLSPAVRGKPPHATMTAAKHAERRWEASTHVSAPAGCDLSPSPERATARTSINSIAASMSERQRGENGGACAVSGAGVGSPDSGGVGELSGPGTTPSAGVGWGTVSRSGACAAGEAG